MGSELDIVQGEDPDGRADGSAPKNIRVLCEAIWRIERDLDLLNRTVRGLHYWPLLRLASYSQFTYSFGFFAQETRPGGRAAKLLQHLTMFLEDLPRFVHQNKGAGEALYMPSAFDVGRTYFTLPIHGVGLEADPSIKRLTVLYRPSQVCQKFRSDRHSTQRVVVLDDTSALLGHLWHRRYLKPMQEEWNLLTRQTRRELGTDFPFSPRQMAIRLGIFAARRRLYRAWFRKSGATRLFIEAAYCLPAIVAAAQDCGIDVCEIQHGVITPYHLGYSYPGHPFVPYCANRLLLLGPYWQNSADLARNTEPVVIGCHYLEPYRHTLKAKVRRRAVVISQGAIGQLLFDIVAEAAQRAPDWQFVFRPHHAERTGDFEEKLAAMAQRPANLTISQKQEDFSNLLASAQIQIGVFSTGLFEGMNFGNRTILVTLPGLDYMNEVIARGEAVVAPSAEAIANLLETAPACSESQRYYAPPVPSITALLNARN